MFYGSWTKEEFSERESEGTVFKPFQIGPIWYRVKELVVGLSAVKFQAEEVSEPEPEPEQESARVEEPVQSDPVVIREPFIPPGIRVWARRKGLLSREDRHGPAYIPPEIRTAYREEFGSEALLQVLRRDSVDARRLYAHEGEFPLERLYKSPSARDLKELTAEEVKNLYRELPRQSSEARIRKREEILAAGRVVTDPSVQARRAALKGKN